MIKTMISLFYCILPLVVVVDVAGEQRGEVCYTLEVLERLCTKVAHSEACVDRLVHTRGFSLFTLRRFFHINYCHLCIVLFIFSTASIS
jgi:hypothetical protein